MRTIRLRVSVLATALLALAISIAPMLAQEGPAWGQRRNGSFPLIETFKNAGLLVSFDFASWGGSGAELVADQFTATAGEDGWTAGEACTLLLATVGGEPSDAAALWEHGETDCGAAAASRVTKA